MILNGVASKIAFWNTCMHLYNFCRPGKTYSRSLNFIALIFSMAKSPVVWLAGILIFQNFHFINWIFHFRWPSHCDKIGQSDWQSGQLNESGPCYVEWADGRWGSHVWGHKRSRWWPILWTSFFKWYQQFASWYKEKVGTLDVFGRLM